MDLGQLFLSPFCLSFTSFEMFFLVFFPFMSVTGAVASVPLVSEDSSECKYIFVLCRGDNEL